jgi:hypothetical protein
LILTERSSAQALCNGSCRIKRPATEAPHGANDCSKSASCKPGFVMHKEQTNARRTPLGGSRRRGSRSGDRSVILQPACRVTRKSLRGPNAAIDCRGRCSPFLAHGIAWCWHETTRPNLGNTRAAVPGLRFRGQRVTLQVYYISRDGCSWRRMVLSHWILEYVLHIRDIRADGS